MSAKLTLTLVISVWFGGVVRTSRVEAAPTSNAFQAAAMGSPLALTAIRDYYTDVYGHGSVGAELDYLRTIGRFVRLGAGLRGEMGVVAGGIGYGFAMGLVGLRLPFGFTGQELSFTIGLGPGLVRRIDRFHCHCGPALAAEAIVDYFFSVSKTLDVSLGSGLRAAELWPDSEFDGPVDAFHALVPLRVGLRSRW